MIARDASSRPKISAKFQQNNPQWGHEIKGGRLKMAIFGQHLAISQKQCKIGI